MSYLVLMCLRKHYFRAGRLDLLDAPWPSRLNLAAGAVCKHPSTKHISYHASLLSSDDLLQSFWEIEGPPPKSPKFSEFAAVMEEYLSLGHAEPVLFSDLQKPPQCVFYLPMHAVHKDSCSTTKLRVVFDASAKSTTGISLNDILMVGPNIHPPLLDVLLRFQ